MHHKVVMMTQEEIDRLHDAATILLEALPAHDEVYHTEYVPSVAHPAQEIMTEVF